MSRGGFKITRCSEQHETPTDSRDHNVPYWMAGIAAKAEELVKVEEQRKEAVTVVDHSREKQTSIHEQMYAIMNGKRPLYSSVEEAVTDYQKKTGLYDHIQNIQTQSSMKEAAAQILSATAEKKSAEDDRALVLDSHPSIKSYIDDITKSNPNLSVPAALHMIFENFSNEGVGSREIDDPNLARYINKQLIDKSTKSTENFSGIGRDDGETSFENEDAFGLLRGK